MNNNFMEILDKKKNYYGDTKLAHEFALREFLDENITNVLDFINKSDVGKMLQYLPDGVGYFGKSFATKEDFKKASGKECELYIIESFKDKCIKKLIEELRQL